MRVLIVGAGIAGPTLAYWLQRLGHGVTLVESAPEPRRGGYLVDFWGAGFDVAERMGIVPRLMDEGYRIHEVREVASSGKRITHFDPSKLTGLSDGRFVSIARADLALAIYDAMGQGVETILGNTVCALDDDGERVRVEFSNSRSREFDLVVGADGLHSRVRALTFGPEKDFERDLGIAVATFDLVGYRPREELVAVTHTRVGAQVLRVPMHDDATMFCLMFRHRGELPDDRRVQHALLRARLGHIGWEVPAILGALPRARSFYIDRASQIRMPSWSRGRIVLIGDAAACPSLLAGQGAALAMIEAYVLACELRRTGGDHRAAFAGYERQLAGLVRKEQDAAVGLGGAFAPRNLTQLLLRKAAIGLMSFPFTANRMAGRSLRDPIMLPSIPLTS
ncbi:2-polyprenyl-6-methoxyphenol hydroxylase [Tessaracoccus bendigoensis DSM 12906]|uniref:2-polyprenyl-6-methoxyphenol hydroxylase n=1 Tax=Tessaracoccus bendigoensis DSM 12906 TaxID=1123357 RepID=A0A1M6BIL8_9ACTN|nr:FAD-binding domain [Tessaracoccus bendigoensis]SHI48438.1 2-polyprenyl-6-methoxyphenol hydroxylase [Tessaracoccus bendigoensis DSM 12906]